MGAHRREKAVAESERRARREARDRSKRERQVDRQARRDARRHGQGIDDLIEESNRV